MASVCLFFQVHHPYQFKPVSIFEIGLDPGYIDEEKSREMTSRMADTCYLPAVEKLMAGIREYNGKFKLSLGISGVCLEQLEKWRPDVIEQLQILAGTGQVELTGSNYYHSLCFNHSRQEFERQLDMHRDIIQRIFGQTTSVFSHPELAGFNHMAFFLSQKGYSGMITEGSSWKLYGRSPNYLYNPPHQSDFGLILRNTILSEDLSFRFSDPSWSQYPLGANSFGGWIAAQHGDLVCLAMDIQTLGIRHSRETGVFKFWEALPGEILKFPHNRFLTPSEAFSSIEARGTFDMAEFPNWTGEKKDQSSFAGNELQKEAAEKVFALEEKITGLNDSSLLAEWGNIQAIDWLTAMSDPHAGAMSLYAPSSPQEAYMGLMNIIADFQIKLQKI